MSADAWFKPKRYGFGYSPANWKGWTVLLVLVIALHTALDPHHWLGFGVAVVLLSAAAFVIVRTMQSRGRWGKRNSERG